MINWFLDYTDRLRLVLPAGEAQKLYTSSFFKLSLRRYFSGQEDDVFVAKLSLTYLDFKRIIALCKKECEKRQVSLQISSSLEQYINHRENFLTQRAKLGIEIQNHSSKLEVTFQAYKDIVNSSMIRPLREQQMWDSFFMCSMRRSANFSVPGSGKTASVLGVYAHLKHSGLVQRIMVVCPKNAFGSWIDEFTATFGNRDPLKVLNLQDSCYPNATARQTALRYDAGNRNLILVNYELAGSVLADLCELVQRDTLLVFDEVHKVKKVGGEYARAALELSKSASTLVAMTGTPIPNGYIDIYNLLHILFPDEYEEMFGFPISVLKAPSSAEVDVINNNLRPFFCRTTKFQLDVPPANPDKLVVCPASKEAERLLSLLQMKYRNNALALFLRILQLESNPKLLLSQLDLRDFEYLLDDTKPVHEIDFFDYSAEVQELITQCPPSAKFLKCIETALSLVKAGKPVIIWCIFIDSIEQLSTTLEQEGVNTRCIYGAIPLEERQQILSDFRSGRIQVLLTNPHTLAESVSLHSVCHDAIYYEYSYNLVHLLQSKDRIHRLGLPKGQYTQYTFLQIEYQIEDGPWSLDRAVYFRLNEKEETMLKAIDHKILEAMPTSKDDLEAIFKQMRMMAAST